MGGGRRGRWKGFGECEKGWWAREKGIRGGGRGRVVKGKGSVGGNVSGERVARGMGRGCADMEGKGAGESRWGKWWMRGVGWEQGAVEWG